MTSRGSIIEKFLVSVQFALVFLFIVPFTVLFYNEGWLAYTSFLFLLKSCFLLFFVCFVVSSILPRYLEKFFMGTCTILSASFLIINFFSPMENGVLDGTHMESSFNIYSIIKLVFIISVISYIYIYKSKSLVKDSVMYGSFGAVLAILVVIYRGEYIFEGTTSYKLSNLSHNKNIFIISLDALPGFVTNKILQENKDFQKELRGFTSFTNTTSSGPSTAISWMGISYGKVFNLDAIPPEIQDNHPDPSLISNSNLKVLMLRNDYNTYTYGAVHPRGIWPTLSEFKKLGKLHIDYKSAKGKKNGKEIKSLMELGLYRIIPLYILEAIDKDFLVKIDHKNFSQEIYDFNSYVNELKVTTDKNIMHISHYNFTHVPIVLDATCSIAAKKGSNKFDAMIEQVKCGVNKFIELIKKLKEKGVYDKSQIFLISDHGMYSKIYEDMDINDPLYFHGQIISSKAMKSLGFSSLRYTPSLIFKDFGDNAPFKFDESPRSLVDIAPTVCYSNLSSMECDKIGYDGISLTSPVEKTRERYFFLYSKEDNRKTTSRDNNENLSLYKKVTIRGDNLYDEITRIMMSTYKKISCDEVINFSDPKSLDKVQILGFSKSSKNETFINDNTGMIGFWTEKSCTLSAIEVSIRAKIKSKNILTRMKIFLNNVLVEEIKINSMDFPEPTLQHFKLKIPSEIFRKDNWNLIKFNLNFDNQSEEQKSNTGQNLAKVFFDKVSFIPSKS